MLEKRVFHNFRYTECDDFSAFLSKKAREGWHFTGWEFGMIFAKGEPEEVTYAVEVFVKGGELDLKATKDTEEYAEFCEEAGWEFVDSNKKFVVFKKVKEDAEEIMTQEERFSLTSNAEIKASAISFIGALLLLSFYINQFLFEGFYYSIFSNSMFAVVTVFGITAIRTGMNLLKSLLWRARNKRKLLYGEEIVFGIGDKKQRQKTLKDKILIIIQMILLILFFAHDADAGTVMIVILFGGLFAICVCFVDYLRPNRVTFVVSILAISIMVPLLLFMFIGTNPIGDQIYQDKAMAPLLQEEYREVEAPFMQVQIEESDNFLGSIRSYYVTYYEYNENPDEEIWDDLDYTIIESEHNWIINRSFAMLTQDEEILEECSKEWGAIEAFKTANYPDSVYVRYEDQIFIIDHAPNLTLDQINIIRNKLKLGQVM